MTYYSKIGEFLEEAFGITEFWYQDCRVAKSVQGIWVKFDKE